MTDWDEIRNACVENGESLKSLAERYGVSYGALRKRASREGWRKQKSRQERETAKREEIERVGRKLLARIETCLDEGKEIDLKEIKAVTGALKELQALDGEPGESGGERTLAVRFVGETEEMSR